MKKPFDISHTAWIVGVMLSATLLMNTGCSKPEKSVRIFEDVTHSAGLNSYAGMTYGAFWGDYDRDGLPDLYVTNHLNKARLYRNLGKGQFTDVTAQHFLHKDLLADKHGAAWADFDNDGRLDLVQLTGAVKGVGVEPKQLFHNVEGRFAEVAAPLGMANLEGRTRMPLWLDFDRDGRLDLFQGAEARLDDKQPPFVFMHDGNRFVASENVLGFAVRDAPFCIATDLTGDFRPELVCRIIGKGRALQVFDAAALPAHDLALLPQTAFEDAAASDFDNDGRIDLFLARKNPPGPVAFNQPTQHAIVVDVTLDKFSLDKPAGFTFQSAGKLRMRVVAASPASTLTPAQIHLGQQDVHPDAMSFELLPDIGRAAPRAPGQQAGVYVGFTAPDKWEVHITAPRDMLSSGKHAAQQVALRIDAPSPITKLEAIGKPAVKEEAPARLFMNRNGKLMEESDKRGVNNRLVPGANVVAGDFNNDMHTDLFVVASGDIGKQPNLLLLNRGDGHFDVVRAAGGAAGGKAGVGDSVTTADFDGDGYLDLLVATGGSMGRSLGLPSDGGGYFLYRNIGGSNHWIEIDLEGTASNRDGIGAVVRVTAGGVMQTRIQDGGVHHRGQNHQRLHFGLAGHTQIDKIVVHWPSGAIQTLSNIKTDQIMRIQEPRS